MNVRAVSYLETAWMFSTCGGDKMTVRKKKKDEDRKVGKITNPKMQTQEGPMTKPSGGYDQTCRPLTAREIAENKRKRKAAKKGK